MTLILAPHPDDETFGCAGLIAHRAGAGETVHVAYLTDGSASHPDHPSLLPPQIAVRRADEAREAASVLGVPASRLVFLNAPDGRLPHLSDTVRTELIDRLRHLVGRLAPSEVFITSQYDGSSEHTAACALAREAIRQIPGPRPRIFHYLVWSRWSPLLLRAALRKSPLVYCHPLSPKETALKHRAIHCYRSQIEPLPPSRSGALPAGFTRLFRDADEFFFEFPDLD